MPTDWTVNGTLTNGLVGDQPALKPTESDSFTFGFYSEVGQPPTHVARYEAVLEYTQYAGTFDVYKTVTGDAYWYEQDPSGSPLVHLVPPDDSPTGRESWGLIDSLDDATTFSQARCELTLSIVFIAPGGTAQGEFDTEADIRAARQARGP